MANTRLEERRAQHKRYKQDVESGGKQAGALLEPVDGVGRGLLDHARLSFARGGH